MLTGILRRVNVTSLVALVALFVMAGGAYAAKGVSSDGDAVLSGGSVGLLGGFPAAGRGAIPFALGGSSSLTRNAEGTFGSFSGESPQALTVDQVTGDVYVVDPSGKELWRYSPGGAPKNFTAGPDAGTNTLTGLSFQSFPSIEQVAVDNSNGPAKGDIYVTQSSSGEVKVFSSGGEPLGVLTGTETPSGGLGEDCGVAVDQATGDLYIGDRSNRIWRYSPSTATVAETDYKGGIETSIAPCQIAVANGNVYAKDWQEFPVEGAGPLDAYPISAFATGTPPSASATQVAAKVTAVATDPLSGDVYADERSKVTVYDPSGTALYSYGSGEIGSFSAGVAVMAGGNSYVSDANNHEIHVYGPTLEPGSRANIGAFGSFTGESPQALTVDQATGDVYVIDPAGKELWRYSSSGAPKNFTAGPDAGTNTLTGLSFQSFPSYDEVAVDNSTGPAKGDIYVTQSPSGEVKVFSSNGESLGVLTGTETPAGGLGEDCGVAVDQATGDLYIGDRANRIWRYSPSGATVVETDYTGGIETGIAPCQIAVANGNVYAKDWQEFPVEGAGPLDAYPISAFATGTPPSASATQVATKVTAVATDPSNGDVYADERSKVTVYSPSGASIYSFASGEIGNSSAGVAIKAGGGDAYVDDAANHKVRIYGPFSAPAPILETKPATNVTHVKATLNGHLDPNNSLPITTCTFQWGTDTNYTETPIACEQGDTYTTPADLTAKLAGLTPGITYHYRLHVTTSNGSYTSEDEHFETTPASSTPEVNTGKGTILSSTSTQMNGTIDPNANPLTACHFQYVNDLAYQNTGFTNLSTGGSIPCDQAPGSIPADYEDHEVTATVTGLDPNQIYRYRLVAENTNGPGNGEATLLPGPPIAQTTGSPTRTATTARLDSRVATHGAHTNYWFEYTTDVNYKANGYSGAADTPVTPLLTSEVQWLYFNWGFPPYSGQFRFTLGSETTRDIPYNATAAEVRAALGALPSVGASNVAVITGGTEREGVHEFYYVTFTGALSGVDLPQLVLSNGTNPLVGLSSAPLVETLAQGGRGDIASSVSASVRGLQPGTTYHYRVVADNGTSGGPTFGDDQTLTTRVSDASLTHGPFPGPRGSDRAWEQVSAPDTDGNASFIKSVADSGERALYGIDGGSPGSANGGGGFGGESNFQLAERTPHGWKNESLFPTRAQAPGNIWRGIWGSTELNELYGFNYDVTGIGSAEMWELRPGRVDQMLYSSVLEHYDPTGNWFAASDDGSRAVIALKGTNDPAYPLPESEEELYDLSSGSPKLVGLLPGNTLPLCGVHMSTGGQLVSPLLHWITPDGSHVFFYAYPNSKCESEPAGLYDRDMASATTKLIAANARFIRSAGGSVFFSTNESLVSGDPGESDIYRYQINDGSYHCVTCSIPGGPDGHADYTQGVEKSGSAFVVSNDGSRIYFIAADRLLPGAAPRGLYRLDVSNGSLAYVAPVDFSTQFSYSSATGTAISPDGSFLAFRSLDPELNASSGQQNGDTLQFYLYGDATGSLVCASCPPDGSAPRADAKLPGVGGEYYVGANGGALNNSGDYVFSTPTALVAADQNTSLSGQEPSHGEDLYEWRDGRLLLITDGRTETKGGSVPGFDGMSPSGRDVFFDQAAALTPDAIDASNHLFDARIGGGFDFPSPPPPCSLEACQGTPLPAPNDATPASLSFSGPGNQTSGSAAPKKSTQSKKCVGSRCVTHPGKKRCVKGKVRKHGKCVKVARKRAKRANHNKGGAK
jgi:hypothetical protein